MHELMFWAGIFLVLWRIVKRFNPKPPKKENIMLNPTAAIPEDLTYSQLEGAIVELDELITDLKLTKNSKAGKLMLARLDALKDMLEAMPAPEDRDKMIFSHGGAAFIAGYNKDANRYEVYSRKGRFVAHSYKTREKAIKSARIKLGDSKSRQQPTRRAS